MQDACEAVCACMPIDIRCRWSHPAGCELPDVGSLLSCLSALACSMYQAMQLGHAFADRLRGARITPC